jgi:hypothetical protein
MEQSFYFEAAGADGKKIAGHIIALSLEEARTKLRQRDLALFLVVPEAQKEDVSSEKQFTADGKEFEKFEFLGTDKEGDVIAGKIGAPDEGLAYKKLCLDHGYELKYLISLSWSEEKREVFKKTGIDPSLHQWFLKEVRKEGRIHELGNVVESKEELEVRLSETQEKKLLVLQEQIGRIIVEVSELLSKNEDILDKNKKREIEERLNLLARLRQSNSIDHLKSLTEKLLGQIADDAIFLQREGAEIDTPELEKRKGVFKKFSTDFDKKLRKQMKKVSVNVEFMNPETWKKKVKKLKPLHNTGITFYAVFLSFFVFAILFWITNAVYVVFANDVNLSLEFFRSLKLWFFTGFSAIIVAGFFPLVFLDPQMKTQKQIHYFSGVFVGLIVYMIQYPVLFFWT